LFIVSWRGSVSWCVEFTLAAALLA
jgi:hypothetical protein